MPSQLFKDVKKGLPSSVSVLEGNASDSITISVDVAEMTVPYSVVWFNREYGNLNLFHNTV